MSKVFSGTFFQLTENPFEKYIYNREPPASWRVTMKGSEDNEVNSYFWFQFQRRMKRRRGVPESGRRRGEGTDLFFNVEKNVKRRYRLAVSNGFWGAFLLLLFCTKQENLYFDSVLHLGDS